MALGAESQAQQGKKLARVAFYIDAFNLYYGIVNLKQPHLKWVNLWDLCTNLLAKKDQQLVKVVFCTAYNTKDEGKLRRHQTYVKVLEHFGVTCVKGHFVHEPRTCKNCGHGWIEASEKQTDVNLALHLFHDAGQDIYDHAYLFTADSDQAAVAKMLKQVYPTKRLTSVVPPTKQPSHNILTYADPPVVKLTIDHLEKVVLPDIVMGTNNGGQPFLIARRPSDYAPPSGWVHPKDRPVRK